MGRDAYNTSFSIVVGDEDGPMTNERDDSVLGGEYVKKSRTSVVGGLDVDALVDSEEREEFQVTSLINF